MAGTFYGVSVGPGAPELMTLGAVRVIERCGTIAVPRTHSGDSLALSIAGSSCDMSCKRIIYLDFPMVRDKAVLDGNYDRNADIICAELAAGDLAMLALGDISMYSTCSYIADRVAARGYEVRLCAGVTSFSAAASVSGIPLAEGGSPLTIIPYGCRDMSGLLRRSGKKVIMKCSRPEELAELLSDMELLESVIAVEKCGMQGERVLRGADIVRADSYFTVYIVGGANA